MEARSRRGWIKNAFIVFLIVLLLLTFFSNTILNHSLPEVSAQYTQYDTISTAIRASGIVKANESYSVIYDEADNSVSVPKPGQTRKIVSVYVRQGSVVQIGDPILALEGGASAELTDAEKRLEELEHQYSLDLLDDSIRKANSDKAMSDSQKDLQKKQNELYELQQLYAVLQAGTDPTGTLKEQKKNAQKEAEGIQKQITELNSQIAKAEDEIRQAEGVIQEDYSGKPLTVRYSEAKTAYQNLQAEYDRLAGVVDQRQAAYDALLLTYADTDEIRAVSQTIESLRSSMENTVKGLERTIEDYYNSMMAETEAEAETPEIRDFKSILSAGLASQFYHVYGYLNVTIYSLDINPEMYVDFKGYIFKVTNDGVRRSIEDTLASIQKTDEELGEAYAKLQILGSGEINELENYAITRAMKEADEALKDAQNALADIQDSYSSAKSAYESLEKQKRSAETISNMEPLLAVYRRDLEIFQENLEAVNEKIAEIEEEIQDAAGAKDPEDVLEQMENLKTSIADLEDKIGIDTITAERTDKDMVYKREQQKKEIDSLKADIDAMKNAPAETVVTAPIAGKIVEMNYVAGNSISSGMEVTRIEVADLGYTCEISMSSDEARRIQVGTSCTVLNSWWYSDIKANVSQIRADPQSQGQNRIVVINVQGDSIYENMRLDFSIGDQSQSYDSVLPNSAIREDRDGKFVLVVESKQTPLSVRYTAVRYNVEILAADATKSAVSGLNGNEFVITSSTSPITNGQQVRLAEN